MKNFDTKIFLKHRRVPRRILSALKQNSTENSDILFLCIKNFRYIKISDSLKHRWVTLRSYSVRSCETKFSTKPLHPPPLSLLTHNFFFRTRNFPHEVFRHCEAKNFRQNRDAHPLILTLTLTTFCVKIFDTRIFLKHRRAPLRTFPTR